MNTVRWLLAVALAFLSGACSAAESIPIRSGTPCFRCGRPIEDVRLAAEVINEHNLPYMFRTPGCMAKYLIAHPEEKHRAVFVTDSTTGRLVRVESALFVRATINDRTNERDYVAFRQVPDAMAFANKQGGTPIDWPRVLSQTRASENLRGGP